MYPGTYARTAPRRVAARLLEADGTPTGEELTYAQLDDRSIRVARVLADVGLRRGDVVALLSTNRLEAFEVYWAALRSGLYVTAINHHLAPDEIAYIVADSGARALIVSDDLGDVATTIVDATPAVERRLAFGGPVAGHDDYAAALAAVSGGPLEAEPAGLTMLYSSGTTGRPKGVRGPLPEAEASEYVNPLVANLRLFGVGEDTVYLSPAPIYHAAPLRWCGSVQAWGGTVVMTRRFEPEGCLRAIAEQHATHAQFVPTMFVRMLKLDPAVRASYDVSSLRVAVHAAAPCPVEVKQKMIDWWGPVLMEYYAGTEGHGMTVIGSPDWLARPGSVGRPVLGRLRICADVDDHPDAPELGVDEVGVVYFERDEVPFAYHNDPDKSRAAQHPRHPTWTTVGDLGRVDPDGFLFLSDRRSFLIISGGVNIYPAEIENVLALHEAVHDVAVIGVPDEEMGESVVAVVAPALPPGPALAEEIAAFVRDRIARYKTPRHVAFVEHLPRTETGKLQKGRIRDEYLAGAGGPSSPGGNTRAPGTSVRQPSAEESRS